MDLNGSVEAESKTEVGNGENILSTEVPSKVYSVHEDLENKVANGDFSIPSDAVEAGGGDAKENKVVNGCFSIPSGTVEAAGDDAKPLPDLTLDETEHISDACSSPADEMLEREHQKDAAETEDDGYMDILGNGQLTKRIIRAGETNSRPEKGQIVTVKCVGRLDDGTEVDKHDELKLCVGDDDFLSAFDLCLPLMDRGELCEVVTASRFAYGVLGREPDIPANATITYEIELLDVKDLPEFHTLTVAYRVKLSNEKRERGNVLYSRGEHSRAVDVYNKALKMVDDENDPHTETPSELQLLADTRVKCYNNLAAAQIKVEAWDVAIRSCDRVLRTDPDNVKALFRKGKCLASKGEYEEAVTILHHALKLDPSSKIIQQELAKVNTKVRESNRSQKELFQKMLGTDKQPPVSDAVKTELIHPKRDIRWMWYVLGALSAMAIPIGMTIYHYYIDDKDA